MSVRWMKTENLSQKSRKRWLKFRIGRKVSPCFGGGIFSFRGTFWDFFPYHLRGLADQRGFFMRKILVILLGFSSLSSIRADLMEGIASDTEAQDRQVAPEWVVVEPSVATVSGTESVEELRSEFQAVATPSVEATLQYLTKVNELLPTLPLDELNGTILEMEGHLNRLLELEEGPLLEQVQAFKEQQFENLEETFSQAREKIEEGALQDALILAQISAYKSRYQNEDSLRLLQEVLNALLEKEADEEKKLGYQEQVQFVTRVLASRQDVILEPTEQEQRVNELVDSVTAGNQETLFTQGRERLEELDQEVSGQSAKLKFFLARQYIRLSRAYRDQSSNWLQKASEALGEGKALSGKHLDSYPQNSLWASRSKVLSEDVDSVQEQESPALSSVGSGNEFRLSRFEMNALTTLSILEAGANCQEETLDVAQVIFNRINYDLFNQDNVSEVVFAQGQFQPYFSILGRANASRRQRIFGTTSSAAEFAAQYREGLDNQEALSRIQGMESDLADETKMQGARSFVGGRTFFLGANMSFHPDRGDIRRREGCNHYKIGLTRSAANQHREFLQGLENQGPLKVTVSEP